jgi:hypothetical protein
MEILYIHRIAFVARHGYNPPNDEQCSYWKSHLGSLRAYPELLTKRISKTLRNLAPSQSDEDPQGGVLEPLNHKMWHIAFQSRTARPH